LLASIQSMLSSLLKTIFTHLMSGFLKEQLRRFQNVTYALAHQPVDRAYMTIGGSDSLFSTFTYR